MAKKIYISGNALRVDDTVSLNVDLDVLKKNVYYKFTSLTNDRVNFIYKRLDGSYENYIHPLSDCVDEDLNPFTESDFRTFCNRNLGFDLTPIGLGGVKVIKERTYQFINKESQFSLFGNIIIDGLLDIEGELILEK